MEGSNTVSLVVLTSVVGTVVGTRDMLTSVSV